MADITLNNTVSFPSTSMRVTIKSDEDKTHFTPYILVPAATIGEISQKLNLGWTSHSRYVQLFSIPEMILDKGCTSGCTASVWSRIKNPNALLVGNYEFAVELFQEDMSDIYIVATCNKSVLYLN
jgi:hypothetical protein